MDNQADFTEVFGEKPTIIDPNIIISQDYTSTARILYSLGEKCKLDVFYIFVGITMSDMT